MPKAVRVCLAPRLSGVGGMVSFQARLAAGLAARGIEVGYDLQAGSYAAVLVVGGTHQLALLWQARRRGARLVQRLDGMNWLHRVPAASPSPGQTRHFLRAEYGNWLLAFIRRRLAHTIVYQSEFSRQWWERARGTVPAPSRVVYNGVDLAVYSPLGPAARPPDRYRILLLEGSLMGGYEQGLGVAVELRARLEERLREEGLPGASLPVRPVELQVVGRVAPGVQAAWDLRAPGAITWAGLVPRDVVPEIDRSAHLLYSADLNPACPNAVIEALACGLPVVAFATGAIPELVTSQAGRVVPYGGDPWRLDPPDLPALVQASWEVLAQPQSFRDGARRRAEAAFGVEQMVAGYLEALLG